MASFNSNMPNSRPQALLSVSDKRDIVSFAQALEQLGFNLLSTGGTAKTLSAAGITVTEIADYTGFPEILDGRVKTLHPKVHGGILARRDLAEHRRALSEHQIGTIDLVCVNLYPFAATIAQPDCTYELAVENIDIGGPTMIRAAAKNHQHVIVVTDPSDYNAVLQELSTHRAESDWPRTLISLDTKKRLAAKAFGHTADYDRTIYQYLQPSPANQENSHFPETLPLTFHKVQDLRYGENPHQQAAFYRDPLAVPGSLATYQQLHGKELSYNNLADADAAWECVKSFTAPACVIVKHANPCGIALGENLLTAYQRAFASDPTSAFGGIIACNCPIDEATAQAIQQQFAEVIIAPAYSPAALTILQAKANIRLLSIPLTSAANTYDLKRIGGGLLLQTPDQDNLRVEDLQVVTARQPRNDELQDLLFAWQAARFVKSNAIVFARQQQTLGIGAGQMSRVDSTAIAAIKAQKAGFSLTGAVAASDAFFPFRDGIDIIADNGIQAIIQPGGSMRDPEVIAAANERNLAMVFTNIRHFRH